ncbi:MAG: hypothetical protein AB8B97_17920 [Granulosicoccus sp.]
MTCGDVSIGSLKWWVMTPAMVILLLACGCATSSLPPSGAVSGGVETSQQMDFNRLILEHREQISQLREEVLLHRQQIYRLTKILENESRD